MRQNSGQSISNYYSQTASMWKQLAVANLPLKYAEDVELFAKYMDCRRFTQFIMGFCEDFEPTRAAFLFLHLMLLSRNLFFKRIDVLTITYLLQMLFWLLLVLQRLLLINLVVIASSVKSPAMTSLSVIIASRGLTKRNRISLVVFFLFRRQPL